ncbi:MAG: CIA30 family protein [Woeseiaceae bacterium]
MHQNFALRVVVATAVIFTVVLFILPTRQSETPEALPADAATNDTVIAGVTLFDGKGWQENTNVVIRDGQIKDITTGEYKLDGNVIDGADRFLIPGLIDAHTHSYGSARSDAQRFGVTTMLDMFSAPALLPPARATRDQFEPATEAALFSAGMLATVEGGHGTQFGVPIDTLSSPDQAADWVAKRKAEGSDYIKLVYIPESQRIPSLDLATATAVIEAAHAAGMMAAAHIDRQDAAWDLMEAGIDGFVHIFADSEVTDAFIKMAIDNDIFVIPTLTVIAMVDGQNPGQTMIDDPHIGPLLDTVSKNNLATDFGGKIPGFSLDVALRNTGKMHAAGIKILAGSDAPNPGTAHGATIHQEMRYLVASGLTPNEALAAATSLPAEIFGLNTRGSIDIGKRADLLLLSADPRDDIIATRQIDQMFRNGYPASQQKARVADADQQIPATLGDFETNLDAPPGLVWTASTDEMMGGSSTATITQQTPGADNSAGALTVDATVSAKFGFPWAGAYLGLTNPTDAASIKDYDRIRFFVKGTPTRYRLMMFSKDAFGAPPTQTFEITDTWTEVTLDIEDFVGFEAGQFTGLIFATPMDAGEYTYSIDRVRLEANP